jgi:hypothetical protein
VAADKTFTLNPNVSDVRTAKVTVVTQDHEDFPDVETIGLDRSGTPYPMNIETLRTRSSIGSIHGSFSVQF